VQGSFTDAGVNDAPWTYSINWGMTGSATPAAPAAPNTPITASRVYTTAGTYSATMTVRDKDGTAGTSARITVTVTP
jgi:hypothetical protein